MATTTTTTTTTTNTWAQVRAACRAFLDLSIGDAVAASHNRDAATNLVASAITGAVLEYGFTGNNSRVESARAELAPVKGKGAKARALALRALELAVVDVKPRQFKAQTAEAMLDWCIMGASMALESMLPAKVASIAAAPAIVATDAPALESMLPPSKVAAPAIVATDAPAIDVSDLVDLSKLTRSELSALAAAIGAELARREMAPF
jgi:hypothetical protein